MERSKEEEKRICSMTTTTTVEETIVMEKRKKNLIRFFFFYESLSIHRLNFLNVKVAFSFSIGYQRFPSRRREFDCWNSEGCFWPLKVEVGCVVGPRMDIYIAPHSLTYSTRVSLQVQDKQITGRRRRGKSGLKQPVQAFWQPFKLNALWWRMERNFPPFFHRSTIDCLKSRRVVVTFHLSDWESLSRSSTNCKWVS